MQEMNQSNLLSSSEYRDNLEALANFYTQGYEIDWERLHQGEAKRRISLPTYPFARERHWIRSATQRKNQVAIPIQDDSHHYKDSDLASKIELKGLDAKQPPYASAKSIPNRININEVKERIINLLAVVLYLPKEQIVLNKNVSDLGIDSILGVEMIRKINAEFNLNLPATKLYDYPTVDKNDSIYF